MADIGEADYDSTAKGFSSDLLGRKIRANVITPGTTDTPAFEKFVPAEQIDVIKKHFAAESLLIRSMVYCYH